VKLTGIALYNWVRYYLIHLTLVDSCADTLSSSRPIICAITQDLFWEHYFIDLHKPTQTDHRTSQNKISLLCGGHAAIFFVHHVRCQICDGSAKQHSCQYSYIHKYIHFSPYVDCTGRRAQHRSTWRVFYSMFTALRAIGTLSHKHSLNSRMQDQTLIRQERGHQSEWPGDEDEEEQ